MVRSAQLLLFAFILSMPLMRPRVRLFGLIAIPSDFLYLALAACLGLGLATRRLRIPADRAWWMLAAYFAAMLASLLAAGGGLHNLVKLVTEAYLLSLPLAACTLLRDEAALRRAVLCWLAATAAVVAVALLSLVLFYLDPGNALLRYTRFHFGSLPPGLYPRLRMTFLNANLACNYLTVSLMLLLAGRRAAWIGRTPFRLLMTGTLIAAALTVSPGFGGVLLALAVWLWLVLRQRESRVARLPLLAGAVVGALFVLALAVTPVVHPTAPFLIHVPLADVTLAPSGRLLAWLDALRNIGADPLFGRGIGADAVHVPYRNPSGELERLTDAHNVFLNVGAQCGLIGVAALVALIFHAARRCAPLRLAGRPAELVRAAVGIAFLNALVYQGLGGSFEDSRHLWLALGLLLASDRIARGADGGTRTRTPRGAGDFKSPASTGSATSARSFA